MLSPSVMIDRAWHPVKKYIDERVNIINERDYFDEFNEQELFNILETQEIISNREKNRRLYSVLLCIDAWADDTKVSRHTKSIHGIFTRGRHNRISCMASLQKSAAIRPIIRVNRCCYIVCKTRNYQDLRMVIEETSGLLNDEDTFYRIYRLATTEPHLFLDINLKANSVGDMLLTIINKNIEFKDI